MLYELERRGISDLLYFFKMRKAIIAWKKNYGRKRSSVTVCVTLRTKRLSHFFIRLGYFVSGGRV